jgi:hypothetical protein
VVLGNVGTSVDVQVLTRALDYPEPLMREHAAWALERIGAPESVDALARRPPGPSVPARQACGRLAQVLVDEAHGRRALADGRGDALD